MPRTLTTCTMRSCAGPRRSFAWEGPCLDRDLRLRHGSVSDAESNPACSGRCCRPSCMTRPAGSEGTAHRCDNTSLRFRPREPLVQAGLRLKLGVVAANARLEAAWICRLSATATRDARRPLTHIDLDGVCRLVLTVGAGVLGAWVAVALCIQAARRPQQVVNLSGRVAHVQILPAGAGVMRT